MVCKVLCQKYESEKY